MQEVVATLDTSPNCSMSVTDVAAAPVSIAISPNPMADLATISTKPDVIKVEFYSMTGSLVLSESGRKINAVDVRRLIPGNYVAVLTLQDGTQYSRKVIKK
ncbi:T9SS type A sorting domain-containing protein [Kaistella sp. PBT33-4]|uniref:T9SS type A sorting domain-containing protein n=1 Tax=Kaistella sp. PBT33-4 TaxID=3032000 RepID=UPI0023D80254|nr:T9SS type A sorting domain-containing protein [Kaistella sp. PBT33-4]MDF0718899.1 T9SS type A sorting domain-containing protein [Kaistella sp. PBT33-4]